VLLHRGHLPRRCPSQAINEGRRCISCSLARRRGRCLIAAIEETPDLKHVRNFLLDAQAHALQFYAYLGYEAYGEEFIDAGIPHRQMKKRNQKDR
jgi:predicted GNAT family N-acyltransferase